MAALKITVNGVTHNFNSGSGVEALKADFSKVFGDNVRKIDSREGDITFDEIDALTGAGPGVVDIGYIKGSLTM
jgi:hypothetical protein